MKNKEVRYGEALFDGIETIRTSRFSHYLVSNSGYLEINAMKAIYLEMREIKTSLMSFHGVFFIRYTNSISGAEALIESINTTSNIKHSI